MLQIQAPPPCSNAECIVRSFHGESSRAIWLINPTKQELTVNIAVSAEPKVLRGKLTDYNAKVNTAHVTIPSRDAVILRMPA
jgi:hypothetical protein